jgi:soluble lytic murein transglycosylase-like protein
VDWKRAKRTLATVAVLTFSSGHGLAHAEVVMERFHGCFLAAGAKYNLSPTLLKGIALTESSGRDYAKNLTHRLKTKTIDVGLMQINSSWFPLLKARYGIKPERLTDGCTSIDVAGWILAHEFKKFGNQWDAVGAYNAACRQLGSVACAKARQTYSWRVFRMMRRVEATEKSATTQQVGGKRS